MEKARRSQKHLSQKETGLYDGKSFVLIKEQPAQSNHSMRGRKLREVFCFVHKYSPHCAILEMLAPSQLGARGYSYFLFSIVTGVVSCSAVCLRVWIRLIISKSFGVEDILLLLSLVSFAWQHLVSRTEL